MRRHELYTADDFKNVPPEHLEHDRLYDLVVDGGLSVCKICMEYEAGLDKPCKERKIYVLEVNESAFEFDMVNDAVVTATSEEEAVKIARETCRNVPWDVSDIYSMDRIGLIKGFVQLG
jgi:hypothetical protein